MGDAGKEDLPNQVVLEAKNTDGEWNTWFTINLDTGKLRLRGNTDQSNLWFYETRKDMTPRKLVRFVKEINAFITSVKPHILVRHLIDPEDYQELKGTPNDAYDDDRYFMGAESFRVGDEGMFEGGEVRITSIEDNSEDGRQNVYFFTYLDEEGNSDGFTHTSGERRFLNQFSMFPRDWNAEEFPEGYWEYDVISRQIEKGDRDDEMNHRVVARDVNINDGRLITYLHNEALQRFENMGRSAEEFEAQRIQYDYVVHREPRGTEVDDEGNRIPNPRGGWFTSAPDRRDAEDFEAESPIVAFRYKDDSPAHVCSGRGYTNTTRCGQNVNWDRIHYPYHLNESRIIETLDSVDNKGMITFGPSARKRICLRCYRSAAQDFDAEEIEERRRKRCKDCEAENVGTEEVDYCYTCGEMGQWGDSESPESCPECGRNSVGTEDVDYCYTCGSFGLWYETLGYYEGEEFEATDKTRDFYNTCSTQSFNILGRKLYYRCSHIGTFTGAKSAFNKGGLNTYSGGQRGLRTAADYSDIPIMNTMAEISQEMQPSDISDWREVISATNQIMARNRPRR